MYLVTINIVLQSNEAQSLLDLTVIMAVIPGVLESGMEPGMESGMILEWP